VLRLNPALEYHRIKRDSGRAAKRDRPLLSSRFYLRRVQSVGAHKKRVRLDRSFVPLLQSTSNKQAVKFSDISVCPLLD